MNFAGRTAIVTGAARGIGRAICLELGRCGCNIAFTYLKSKTQAEQLSDELAAMGREVFCVQASVADFGSANAMVQEVQRRFGSVDYLVNNAGVVKDKLLLRMTEGDWDEVVDTNLKGAFNFSKAVSSIMVKARFGSILNITSVSGLIGNPGQANYAASKAGLIGLTKSLAKELAGRNITVNALALGFVDTEMTRSSVGGSQGNGRQNDSPGTIRDSGGSCAHRGIPSFGRCPLYHGSGDSGRRRPCHIVYNSLINILPQSRCFFWHLRAARPLDLRKGVLPRLVF